MRLAVLVLACGCRSILGIESATVGDSGTGDTLADTSPSALCLGSFVRVCFDPPPGNDLELSTQVFDTSNISSCTAVIEQPGGPSLCAIAAKNIAVNALSNVQFIGARPVVLFAAGTITIDGAIDASSKRTNRTGAGAATNCNAGIGLAAVGGQGGGGGGAGGTLGDVGGVGGTGSGGASGGSTIPASQLTRVRGGCRGGNGGTAGAMMPGAGGDGGGAIYFLAGSTITIRGRINASGAAGGPGGERTGGGGGGAGGMIGFEAGAIALDSAADVFALGGSGASGSSQTLEGIAGNEATGEIEPLGPIGMNGAGSGGNGSAKGGGVGGNAITQNCGGGGGGGAGGVILAKPLVIGTLPMAQLPPD